MRSQTVVLRAWFSVHVRHGLLIAPFKAFRHANFWKPCYVVVASLMLAVFSVTTRADINEWEWIDPDNHDLGKVDSGTACLGGAGVSALPSADLSNRDLTQAFLIGANLTHARLTHATLTNADFSGGTLTGTDMRRATLTGATFSETTINGTQFLGTNLTAEQLYSTASYQAKDLHHDTYTTGFPTNVGGWDFSGQDLTNTRFMSCTLNNTNFSNATIARADFSYSNLTTAQLYSTTSYQLKDLHGFFLRDRDLSGWDFSGQNLTSGSFQSSTLHHTSLVGANLDRMSLNDCDLMGADLSSATLTDTDFTHSDLRGATVGSLSLAKTEKTIMPDGSLRGLEFMAIRNCDEDIPIHFLGSWSLTSPSWLGFLLDDQPWNSTISFDSGASVSLNGELFLDLASDAEGSSLAGKTFKLFDWTGVNRVGTFQTITIDYDITGYGAVDTSRLYTTGEITVLPEPSTLTLLGFGAIGLIVYVCRSRNRQQERTTDVPLRL